MKYNCPLCGAKETRAIGSKQGYVLNICGKCSFCFLGNDFAYQDFYDGSYFKYYDNPSMLGRKDIADEPDGPAADYSYASDPAKRGRAYRSAIGLLKRYVSLKGKKFLDIGCAEGVGMRIAEENGAIPFGLDVSAEAIDKCRISGLENAYVGELSAVDISGVELAVMIDVLEHMQNPRKELSALDRAMVMGGLVYVDNNLFDPIRFQKDSRYLNRYFEPPYHCSYFTRNHLLRLFRDNGFELIYAKPRCINAIIRTYVAIKGLFRPDFRESQKNSRLRRLTKEESQKIAKGSSLGKKLIFERYPPGFLFRKVSDIITQS